MSERTFVLTTVVLVVCFWVFMFRDSLPPSLRRLVGGAETKELEWHAVVAPPKRPAPQPPPVAPSREAYRTKTKPSTQIREREIPEIDITVQLPPTLHEADIRPNMPRSELIERFGEPVASTTGSADGKLTEKLVYGIGVSALEVLVQNGRVISARTLN